jgi:ABC-type transport system substrate-binding protein
MRNIAFPFLRLSLFAVALAGFGALGLWILADPGLGQAAEEKKQKNKEEVEEADQQAAKRPKTPKRAEIEEDDLLPDESRPVDLAAEAKRVSGDLRAFYQSIAVPHDEVTLPRGRVDRVEPLPFYVGPVPDFPDKLTMVRFDKDGKRRKLLPVRSKEIKSVASYEQVVLKAVNALVAKKDLPRLLAGENGLVAALRFHASEQRIKRPEDARSWAEIEGRLRSRLHELRRDHALALGKAGRWPEAFRLAERLVKENPRELEDRLVQARLTLARAEDSGRLDDYLSARAKLLAFESRFPQSPQAEPLRKGLKEAAQKLVQEANELGDKDKAGAIDRLRRAAKIWPQLPDLQDKLRAADRDHPILYVGVRALPQAFSPATAVTDTERQAVELLFEGLVKPSTLAGGAPHYNAALAESRPRVVPHGREFVLPRDALWSDGKRLTAADVRHTVHLLKSPELPGHNSAWARLVEDPRVEGSAYRARIDLRHGYLDPLSLMTFKVLPHQFRGKPLERANDEDFSTNPVGSGPFVLQGTADEENKKYLVFAANPFYQRASRPAMPRIREIRFFESHDPAGELRGERLHLLPDVPTGKVPELLKGGFRPDDIRTLASRRVYFLAVNHGVDALENEDLRQAIAHAIDREAILRAHFRAGFEALDRDHHLVKAAGLDTVKLHPALNGPYPAGSWACSPDVSPQLYDLDRAGLKARAALKKLKKVELRLSYPTGDPRVEGACKDICAALGKLSDRIRVAPEGLSPRAFRKAINRREYELAYCHYDYASEAFWLWPLFDPDPSARAPGGSNILRYHNDDLLESYFRKAMSRRDFSEIKKMTHNIHNRLNDKMPLIPLWQLHTHIAVHGQLDAVGLDPLLIFTHVEEWQLGKK